MIRVEMLLNENYYRNQHHWLKRKTEWNRRFKNSKTHICTSSDIKNDHNIEVPRNNVLMLLCRNGYLVLDFLVVVVEQISSLKYIKNVQDVRLYFLFTEDCWLNK